MRFFKSIEEENGFTLLEVLLAMTLFAVVVSVVYSSYSATFTTAHHLEARIVINNKARIVMERLVEDLESVYLGHGGFLKGERKDVGENRGDTLQFTSTAHLIFNKDQLPVSFTTIGYRVATGDDDLLHLYRSDSPYRPAEINEIDEENLGYLLCDGLKSVQLTYINQEDEEVEDWNSNDDNDRDDNKTKKIPKMILITLIFADSVESGDTQVFKTGVSLPVMNVFSTSR